MTTVILDAAEQCKAMTEAEDSRLTKIAEIVKNPMTFAIVSATNFNLYKTDIMTDITLGLAQREAGLYFYYGRNVGKAIALLLLGKDNKIETEEWTFVAPEVPEVKIELVPVVDPVMPVPSDEVIMSLI